MVANFGNTVDIADSDSDSDSDSQEDRDDNGEDSMIERPSTTDIDEDEVGDSIASLPAANKMSPKIARKNSLVLLNPMHYLRRGSETRSSATSGPISTEIEVEMRSSERRRSKAGRNKSININSNRGIALSEGEKLDWGDEFDDAGEWKRKVLEEQQQKDLDAMKQNVIKQKLRTKMKKKKKSADKSIHEVQIVFPLPSKDPLLSHRKIFDFSRAYHLEDDDDYRKKSIR